MWPQISISLWAKRSCRKTALSTDKVVKFSPDNGWRSLCRLRLSSLERTWLCARPSSWVDLQELAWKAQFSLSSHYCLERCPESSVKSLGALGETMNSLPLTQQLMSSPSTNALAKNSLMMHSYTSPIGFNNLVHVLSLNTSRMNVSFKDLMYTKPIIGNGTHCELVEWTSKDLGPNGAFYLPLSTHRG